MKVIVGGCSVSDFFANDPETDSVYGQILATRLGADYVHHAASAGSNYRIWRKITQMAMNNEITKDDIVVMQYTELTRQEFWSASDQREGQDWKDKYNKDSNGGNIVRYKNNTSIFNGRSSEEKKFFELKEKYFTSIKFDEERFEYHHYLFHNLMMSKDINVAYLVSPNRPLRKYSWDDRHLFNKNDELHVTLSQDNDEHLRHLDDGSIDYVHFGKKGHKYVATVLEDFIKEKGWQ